jgi:hypothetical protein
MTPSVPVEPSWKWGTSEGSREFDRLLDRRLTFREKLEWLEEMETLFLRMHANRMETGSLNHDGADSSKWKAGAG